MRATEVDRRTVALGVAGVGFVVWSLGLLLGNLLAAHVSTRHSGVVINHGLHGAAYIVFTLAAVIVRGSLAGAIGRNSVGLLFGGLSLLGVLNLYGAYDFAVNDEGISPETTDIINYGVPLALGMLGAALLSASFVLWGQRKKI